MASKLVICVLLFAVVGCTFAKLSRGKGKGKAGYAKNKKAYKTVPIPEVVVRPCDGVSCGVGRECIVTEEQEPSCQCVQSCDSSIEHIICGSDDVTYPNKCELHRAACIYERKITQVKVGPCEAAPTVSHTRPTKPVVCLQEDRNVLHQQLVQMLESQQTPDGWVMRGMRYLDVLEENFRRFDESGDDVIDSTEFLKFVEETVRNLTSLDDNTENQKMRSMCVDALLTEADADSDWILNKREFDSGLSADFEPVTKMCSLEGREYAEGEEMQKKCNECVCAGGNWVCSANACDGDMVAGTNAQEEYDTAEENAMNDKEWKAIMKKLAVAPPNQFPNKVRDLKRLTEKINAALPPVNHFDEIMGEEDLEQMELMAEEMAMDVEEQEAPAEVEELPVAPVQIDEGPVPPAVGERPRILDRIRPSKRVDRTKHKGKGKGKHGKRNQKMGGRGKN